MDMTDDEKLAADPKLTYDSLPIGARQIRDHDKLVQTRNEVNALRALVLALATRHSHSATGEAVVPAEVLVQAAAAAPRRID